MEAVYLTLVGALLVGVVVLLAIFKREWLVKGWKYIAGVAVALAALFFIFGRRRTGPSPEIQQELQNKREELRRNIDEIKQEGEVEVTQAKQKEQEITNELNEIEEIQNEEEKLRRLEELFNKTRRR